MSIFEKIEKNLENIFERAFTRVFRKKIEPLELAYEIERLIEETAITDVKVPYAANAFRINLSKADFALLEPFIPELKAELSELVSARADQLGLALLGAPEIIFEMNTSIKTGEMRIIPEVRSASGRERPREADLESTRVIPIREVTTGNLQVPEAIIEDLENGRRYQVVRFPYRIGRMEANDLRISNPTVSRFHAEIYKEGSSYYIRDLESTNGTFLNGKQIKVKKLKDGDIITVGSSRLRWLVQQ